MTEDVQPVPVRTIMLTIGLVLACVLGVYLVVVLARIETLLVVAVFLAVAFTPPVDFVRRHLHLGRGPAVLVVLVVSLGLLGGMLFAFISPVVRQGSRFATEFPTYLSDAEAGRGPLGGVVKKYELDQRYEQNKAKISAALRDATGGALGLGRKVFSGIVSLLTVVVLAILMVLYGPELLTGALGVLPPSTRRRVKAVSTDCARSVTGYVTGNLVISLIAATVTYVALFLFGVPFRFLLAMWVAFTDLLPLIGATLGAIPTIGIALLHSTTAGVGMAIVYFVYQQLENNVLSVVIMSQDHQDQPAGGSGQRLGRRRTVRSGGRAVGPPGRGHPSGHCARPLGPPNRPTQGRAHGGGVWAARRRPGRPGGPGRR